MTKNAKITIAIVVAFVAVAGAVLAIGSGSGGSSGLATSGTNPSQSAKPSQGSAAESVEKTAPSGTPSEPASGGTASSSLLVRANSHKLQVAPDGKATFVEFLDFECPACGAAYPAIEQLRKEFNGRVTFVVRYLPLPMHFNADRAARAVESAARQGKFEQMYKKMYDTQQQWGEQKVPADKTFRGFAQELGLDLATYDKDYASAEVKARVQQDVKDANALGIQGTPSFYLNGKALQPKSYQDLVDQLDKALAK